MHMLHMHLALIVLILHFCKFFTVELMQDNWCKIVGYQLTVRYRECSNYFVFSDIFEFLNLDNLELSLAWFGIKRSHGMAELPKWLTADAKLVYVPGHKRWKMSQAIGCWVWRWSEKVYMYTLISCTLFAKRTLPWFYLESCIDVNWIPSRSLTWPLKMDGWNIIFLLGW